MAEVTAYDGSNVSVPAETIEHVQVKHPQMLSLAHLDGARLLDKLREILEDPDEVYLDARNARYFLGRFDDLYLNVIVQDGVVRTAYLLSEQSHRRMEKKRWLRRLC